MSISGALSNALSGLGASSRAAEVVSSNIANALTESYGRRSLEIAPRSSATSGGVRVLSVTRHVSEGLVQDRRLAVSARAGTEARLAFLDGVNGVYGLPGSGDSLADRLAEAEAALVAASARPDATARLATAADALRGLAEAVNAASARLQQERGRADAAIGRDVTALNRSLQRIEQVNEDIARYGRGDSVEASLRDERQRLIDEVAAIVPVRVLEHADGGIALVTPRGAVLFDGRAATLGFSPVNAMSPELSLQDGSLSGITLNGKPLNLDRVDHALSGGRLGGLLDVRDRMAPAAQADLDAFARDLVERFADPGVDPTLAPGDPGLFTDAGGAFVPADEVGLAGRLAFSALADPQAGGDAWRLRDGLGAPAPGDAGQGAGLTRLADAFAGRRTVASGPQAGLELASAGLLSDVMSSAAGALVLTEADAARDAARAETLTARLFEQGVDSDAEMQSLLMIEQAYAANARVIETVEAMLDALMRM